MSGAIAIGTEPLVPGPAIRREYLKLPRDLATLTRSFGITLSPQLQRDAAVLAFSIECADRLLDAIPEVARRARFGAAVRACFQGTEFPHEGVTPELLEWLATLREVAGRHGVSGEFAEIIRDIFKNAEAMRRTDSIEAFVRHAEREGLLMVELLLLIIGEWTTPQFDQFMRHVAAPANLADKLRDARGDFTRGEIKLRPRLGFRLRLSCEIAWRTGALWRLCLGNPRLLQWGLTSLWTELFWFRLARSRSR